MNNYSIKYPLELMNEEYQLIEGSFQVHTHLPELKFHKSWKASKI